MIISKVSFSNRWIPASPYLFIFLDLVNNCLWERICRYCKVGRKRYGNLSCEEVYDSVIIVREEVTGNDGEREVVLGMQACQLRKSLLQSAADVA